MKKDKLILKNGIEKELEAGGQPGSITGVVC